MSIKITSDSTCDLPQELLDKYEISTIPLCVMLGADEFYDGQTITPSNIFEYVSKTKTLPKTAARSVEDFKEFFKQFLDNGDEVVHIGISSGLSVCYNNCLKAKEELGSDKLHIVDGRSLSTGTGLLLIHAAELAKKGKTATQIAEIERERALSTQASFIVETLDYLHKGGRCSTLSLLGANILGIKPRLQVVDSKLISTGKYRGKMKPVILKYIDDTLSNFNNPDTARCFITHASAEPEFVEEVVNYVKTKNLFKEIFVSTAGATITSHCGKGTLGILYINDGGRR